MIQNAAIDPEQDEGIFSAKYSLGKVCVILTAYCLFIYYLWQGIDTFEGIVAGKPGLLDLLFLGSIRLFVLLPVLPLALNPICFKKIIFYTNRVQIVRRIFRSKTIYYSNATVERGTLMPGYLIEEAPENGQQQPSRFLYDFTLFFFHSDAARRIKSILDYLTDDASRKNPRIFKRSMLPGVGCKPQQ